MSWWLSSWVLLLFGASSRAEDELGLVGVCPHSEEIGGDIGGLNLLQRSQDMKLSGSSPSEDAREDFTSSRPNILSIFDEDVLWLLSQWRTCTRLALGASQYEERVQMFNATALKPDVPATSLSLVQITPDYLLLALPQMLRDGVAQKRNMMHVDVDAFLLQDPATTFMDRYPEADIVSAVDFAGGMYQWYVSQDYLARHGGSDPLGAQGNSRVTQMFDELIAARTSIGPTWGDQTLFNEVLLQFNCTWTLEDRKPMPDLDGAARANLLWTTALFGSCSGGNQAQYTGVKLEHLNLVVLPMTIVTREHDRAHVLPSTVAVHPGATNKVEGMALAAELCKEPL